MANWEWMGYKKAEKGSAVLNIICWLKLFIHHVFDISHIHHVKFLV
jgi:hypothetical protein